MQATANEKQSASGGSMISNLQCIFINAINNEKRKIPEELLFFPFCPLSRKEKEIETQRPLRLERP
jgi:hypothetical protein